MSLRRNFYLNIVLSLSLLLLINVTFIIMAEYSLIDWYLFPISLCGVIILYELIKYLRGYYDLFEPRGLIALLGTLYFFISPLLFLSFSRQMLFVGNPTDWGKWVGILSILNFMGLLVYKFVLYYGKNYVRKPLKKIWVLDDHKFKLFLILFGSLALIAQVYFLYKQGGVSGILTAKTQGTLSLSGNGWILMIGESLPLLIFFGIFFYIRKKNFNRSNILIFALLIFFLIIQFYIAGLRGSRSTTVFALFWVVVIIHYTLRPFTRKQFILGLIFVIFFMVGYGYYKNIGTDVTKVFTGEMTMHQLQDTNENRGIMSTVLGDMSRIGTQAFLLYRLYDHSDSYDLAWGKTYIGDISILIPSFILSNPPPSKIKAGTELMYGKGTYIPGEFQSSRVYGILGEGLLNFHIVSVPFTFLIWSLFVLFITRLVYLLPKNDARWLIIPLLIQITFTSVNSDLDNVIFGLFKNGFIPFLLIYISTNKKHRQKTKSIKPHY